MLRGFSKFDICTIGAGTRDVFITSSHFERQNDPHAPAGFDACFPMGTKIELDDIIFETGGGATNAAVTFQNFGLKTACLTAVGADDNGRAVISSLKKHKVNIKGIQIIQQKKTSYSIILLAGTGERSILVYRGASNDLEPEKINWNKFKCSWLYLTSLGGSLKKNQIIFNTATHSDKSIAWNPGNGELKLGLQKLSPLIRHTDIFIVNREEAALLTEQAPRHLDLIIKKLGRLPRRTLIITDGPHGAYAYDIQKKILSHADILPGRRINTTGAGDAFGSAFTAAYIITKNLEEGLRAGTVNSLGVITHMGAKAGILNKYPTLKDLKRVHITHIKDYELS